MAKIRFVVRTHSEKIIGDWEDIHENFKNFTHDEVSEALVASFSEAVTVGGGLTLILNLATNRWRFLPSASIEWIEPEFMFDDGEGFKK